MYRYPSLRVAYIDEKELREKDKIHKEYYSVLIKAVNGLDEVNYICSLNLKLTPNHGSGSFYAAI